MFFLPKVVRANPKHFRNLPGYPFQPNFLSITRGGEKPFIEKVPGAKNQPHQIIKDGGGAFLQEDKGEEIAGIVVVWLQNQNTN